MRQIPNLASILLIFLLILVVPINVHARRKCTGSSSCSACTTCSGCAYCNEEGGTCGVCSSGESYEVERSYSPINSTNSNDEGTESNSSDYSSNQSSYQNYSSTDSYNPDSGAPESEKKDSNWGWWIAGVIGFFVLIGAIGKK